jgi:hypothetical protein
MTPADMAAKKLRGLMSITQRPKTRGRPHRNGRLNPKRFLATNPHRRTYLQTTMGARMPCPIKDDDGDWSGPVMLIMRGNSAPAGVYEDENGNTPAWPKGALHEEPAIEYARLSGLKPKVLDVTGSSPVRGPMFLLLEQAAKARIDAVTGAGPIVRPGGEHKGKSELCGRGCG